MTAALKAKSDKTLNILVKYSEGVMTRKEWINKQLARGAYVEESTKNRIEFNRIKFNRLKGGIWSNEQEEYEKKCNEKVACYKLRFNGENSFWEITKTEFDYFNFLTNAAKHD